MSDDPESPAPTDAGDGPDIEARYRRIFEHSNDAVMVVDLDAESFVDVNPAACDLLGYDREELLDLHPEEIHPDDMDRVRDTFLSQVRETGSGFTDDLTCVTKSGEEKPTEISGAALDLGGEDPPSRMIAMLRDVSDRVRRRRELEATVERLDRFASLVSHDLRTPLSIIDGHVDLARETGDPEHFDAIRNAVDRMDRTLTGLRRLAREGTVEDPTTVDLAALARETWASTATGDATIRPDAAPTIRADPDRVRELLVNLFENAVEHGSTGTGPESGTAPDDDPLTVTVGRVEEAGRSGFYVADDGSGIPPERRDAVLDWRETTSEDGTGIGLAIVTEIAEAHGWEVTVAEAADGGARFEITGVEII